MNLIKNFTYLLFSDSVSKIANFAVMAYLARILLPDGVGLINWIQSIVMLVALIPNFGLNEYGILSISSNRSIKNIEDTVGRILGFRIVIGVATYLGLIVCVLTIPQLKEFSVFFIIGGLLLFATIFSFDWFYTSIENQYLIGFVRIFSKLFYLVSTFLFVHSKDDILFALILLVLNELIFSVALLFLYYSRLKFSIKIVFRNFHSLFLPALPMALYTSSSLIIYSADIVVLGMLISMHDLGLYSSAVKIIALFIALKYLVGQIIYPKIVNQFSNSPQNLNLLLNLINKYSILGSLVLTICLAASAQTLTLLILGKAYAESAPVFILMIPALFCEFCWIAFPYLVISSNKTAYSIMIVSTGIIKIVTIPLAYYLGGLLGCAVAYSLMNIILFSCCIFYIHFKVVRLDIFQVLCYPLLISSSLILLFIIPPYENGLLVLAIGATLLVFYMLSSDIKRFKWDTLKKDLAFINAS